MVSGKTNRTALVQTTEDFASRTSIHGVAYVFDRSHGLVDRVLWFLVVLGFVALASYFTINSWNQWRDEQVSRQYITQEILSQSDKCKILYA